MTTCLRVIAIIACALTSAAWAWRQLGLLPEPDADPADTFVKPTYASLRSRTAAAQVFAAALALGALSTSLPGWWTPLAWALLAGGGSVLGLVDLHTTYLPTRLLRPLGAGAAGLLLAGALALLFHQPAHTGMRLLGLACGAAGSRALFWCMWRWRAGLGFGDVRLATLLGLLTAGVSASVWSAALLSGTLLGAVWALAVVLHRRKNPSTLGRAFAYGPALILGCWIALALRLLGVR